MSTALVPTHTLVPTDSTDQQVIDLWVRSKRNSAHTRATYARAAARLLGAGVTLRTLTFEQLLSFADSLSDLSQGTQKTYLSAVKSLLSFAQKSGYTQFNVGAALELPRPRRTLAERIVDEEAVIRLITLEENLRRRLILRLLYAGGVRVSELCGLRWRDTVASGDAGQITVLGKGDKTRTILLSATTWGELLSFRPAEAAPNAPVFATQSGKAVDRFYVHDITKAAAQRAGLPDGFSPHWLRHAHASHALQRGCGIILVRDTLGHASVETTNQYSHARPDDSSARYLPM